MTEQCGKAKWQVNKTLVENNVVFGDKSFKGDVVKRMTNKFILYNLFQINYRLSVNVQWIMAA